MRRKPGEKEPGTSAGSHAAPDAAGGNRFDRMEWAGAFGDIGTLIPFAVGYITLLGVDPLGLLFAFGASNIAIGLYYRRPVPVQPMKAIGAGAIAHSATITPNMVWGAGLFTGVFWLLMAATGMIERVSRLVAKPVVRGVMLGLGMSFILQGVRMIAGDEKALALFGDNGDAALLGSWYGPAIGVAAIALTLILLRNRKFPAMFALLSLGILAGIVHAHGDPVLWSQLTAIGIDFRLPSFALGSFGFGDLVKGTAVLALAQIPLTLGNAIVAVTAEHNTLFPQHPVSERKVTLTQGLLNLAAPVVGGVPVCHGAGGMAGHVRFGARTGGSTVILGAFLLLLALFFSDSVSLVFSIFPIELLGVILMFAGVELALTIGDIDRRRQDVFLLIITAGICMWNIGWGFLAGVALSQAIKWRGFKL
ncbi:MAG: putative sulfate/molybdate transporter [Thermoleophilia bacterium]